jgi:phenylpropionate dioxygenase-like ring-hydroxylating dioxygenase large terminal subunit
MSTTDHELSKSAIEGRPMTAAEEQYPLEPHLVDANQYNDPDQYRREIEQVFFKSWFPVCPSADVAAPRDFHVWDKLDQSVVVVRLDDGTLSAWHNVCQHRGARLLEASGSCPKGRFSCPWHGFGYDLEGKVTTVPLRDSFAPEQLEGLRAPAVRVEEWSGFVWLAFDDALPDLKSYLGVIGEELDGYKLDTFSTKYRARLELNANWKLVVDAFNETWHVPFTHKGTLTGIIMWRDAILHIEPPHSWMTLPVRGFTERADPQADHRTSHVCHYLAFPNTIFSCFPTHLQMWSAWPISPTKTVLEAYGVIGPTPAGMDDEKWKRQNDRDWAHFIKVTEEDSEVINGFGTVSRSLGFRRNMFNTAESRLTAFHAEISARAGGSPVTETPR